MKKRYALLPLVLVLAACDNPANEIPTPAAETSSAETTQDSHAQRAEQVIEALSGPIEAIADAESLEAAADRLTGPAQRALTTEVSHSARFENPDMLTKLSFEGAQSSWGSSAEYPRVAMAFTNETEGRNTGQLLVMTQENAQANYKLWGYSELFPGEQAFEFAPDSESVPADFADGIVASPAQVGEAYATLLNGDPSDLPFVGSPLTNSIRQQRADMTEAVGDVGEASYVATPLTAQGVMTVRTQNGGVVTMMTYGLDATIKRTVEGSTITLGESLSRYLGDEPYEVQGTLTSHSEIMVAFYISPEDTQRIVVLGASEPVMYSISDDETTNPDNEE